MNQKFLCKDIEFYLSTTRYTKIYLSCSFCITHCDQLLSNLLPNLISGMGIDMLVLAVNFHLRLAFAENMKSWIFALTRT